MKYYTEKTEQTTVTHNTVEPHKQNGNNSHKILKHAIYIKLKKKENYSVALAIRRVITSEKEGRSRYR